MNAAEITAIATGAPAIIGAITALVVSVKSKAKLNAHIKTVSEVAPTPAATPSADPYHEGLAH